MKESGFFASNSLSQIPQNSAMRLSAGPILVLKLRTHCQFTISDQTSADIVFILAFKTPSLSK